MIKSIADLKRNITNPYYYFEYSIFCLLASLLIFGTLSFGFLTKEIRINRGYLGEVKKETEKLREIKFDLVDLQADLVQSQDYLPKLTEAVPDQPEIDTFLLDFVPMAGSAGFGLTEVNTLPQLSDSYSTSLSIELNGDPRNLNRLIEFLATQPRYISVQAINSTVTSVSRVILNIKVFHTPPQSIDFTRIKDARIDTEFLKKEFTPVHERN